MLEKIVRKGIKARISDISFCILKSTFELLFLFKAMVNYIQDMCDAGGIFVVKIYFGNQCQKIT